jgi:hypothetical protein
MNVIETPSVRRERKSAQVSARKNIGEDPAILDIEAFKGPGALPAFFHLIQQQTSVERHAKRLHGRVLSRSPIRRVQQKLILAFCTFTHVNAGLLLMGKALSEKIAGAYFLERVIGFDSKEFRDAFPDLLSPRNVI